MSYFPFEDDIKELANRPDLNYELIVNYMSSIGAELGIQCDDKYALAPEVMSRLKGMWGIVIHYDDSEIVEDIIQASLTEHFDFTFKKERYEVKARRGNWIYERFSHSSGPGCEASKELYSDYFITVTADGFVLCYDIKNKYSTGEPLKNSVTDFNGGYQKRTTMNYYRLGDVVWAVPIKYTDWAVIDRVWDEHNKESKN